MRVEESLNITFDESPPPSKTSPLVDDDRYAYNARSGSKETSFSLSKFFNHLGSEPNRCSVVLG